MRIQPRAFVVSAASLVVAIVVGLGPASTLVGCKDQAKLSAQRATEHAAAVADLAAKDVGEVERGLPAGAAEIYKLVYAKGDPRQDLPAVRAALTKVRNGVPDLLTAKSTFFALADDKGVAIRNDLDPDDMAGKNVVAIFPDLQKAQQGSFVTTVGLFPGPP